MAGLKQEDDMVKDINETQAFLSQKIKENYAKRDDPKYLQETIQACEEQIKIAKDVAKKILEGEKRFTLKSDEDMINELRNENEKDLKIKPGVPKTQAPKYDTKDLPEGFNPNIHKSPDDFVVIPGKLGEHTGYKQLCIIREKEEKWQEVIYLAEQAKFEGWAGDWDKRIEKARKKLK
jgi:hypothetical protein